MSDLDEAVTSHYTHGDLTATVLEALRRMGHSTQRIDPSELAGVDEFHMGGREATVAISESLAPQRGEELLDLGCGIGGPARYFAGTFGCKVTGIDLTPAFVETAEELTERTGLAELVSFQTGSVTALPFKSASFDTATLIHVGMNLPDKSAMAREVFRVLRPEGRFLVYDVMRVGEGEHGFPVPWSREPGTSFLASPEDYRITLEAAGFDVDEEVSHAPLAKAFFARMRERMASSEPPQLSIALLLGEAAKPAFANLIAALEADIIAPVEMLCRKG